MSIINFRNEVNTATKVLKPHALRLTKDMNDADDLIQDTIFRAIVNEEKFKDGTNIKAWLFTIMKNIFINNYRKKVKRNTVLDTTDNSFVINNAAITHNTAEGAFVMNDINKALMNISHELRVPFLMHYKGYKYNEIAEQLNLPLGTVKSRIFFARKELSDILGKEYKVS